MTPDVRENRHLIVELLKKEWDIQIQIVANILVSLKPLFINN